jgi:beta-glucanase (GH16 family)
MKMKRAAGNWTPAILLLVSVLVLLSCAGQPEPEGSGGFATGSMSPSGAGTVSGSDTGSGAAAGDSSTDTPTEPVWELVWSDEFDYQGAPDPEKWGYDVGGRGWGNNELQYYTEGENVVVEDGMLVIEARRETRSGHDYTSTRLVSRGKGDWLYGRIEVRARVPDGIGTWPAIWMLPTDWAYGNWPASGEIDIMEHVGYDPGIIHGTVHTERFNHIKGTQQGGTIEVPDAQDEFHEYAVEWYEDRILFLVDGKQYYRFNPFISRPTAGFEEWPFDKRFHLLINIAVGGSWGGQRGVDEDAFPTRMYVDYVRVYQEKSSGRE